MKAIVGWTSDKHVRMRPFDEYADAEAFYETMRELVRENDVCILIDESDAAYPVWMRMHAEAEAYVWEEFLRTRTNYMIEEGQKRCNSK